MMKMKVKQEEELCDVDFADEQVVDASPTSVYFGNFDAKRATGQSTKACWTEHQDYLLKEAVRKFNGRNWRQIAECIPQRTISQCFTRWKRVLNPEIVKGKWTKEEDECIIESVRKDGPQKWSAVAKCLPGRLSKQCRERWFNHLDPAIRKTSWTEEDELTLIHYHELYGNKSAEIAKFLPGRTDNAIKNHWNFIMKKFDSNLPPAYAMDLCMISSLNFCSCAIKSNSIEVKEERQNPDRTESVYGSTRLKCGANAFGIGGRVLVGPRTDGNHDIVHSSLLPSDVKLPYDGSIPTRSCHNALEAVLPSDLKSVKSPDKLRGYELAHFPSELSNKTLTSGTGKENKVQNIQKPSADTSKHCLYQESAQMKGGNSPVPCSSCSTPSSLVKCNSLESILENAARTFKYTPIIRKRTCREAGVNNSSDTTSTPSRKISCTGINSLRRQLDYAFDMEKDAVTRNCGVLFANAMAIP